MASEHLPGMDQLIREFGETLERQVAALDRIAASIETLARLLAGVDKRSDDEPRGVRFDVPGLDE
jgi:hypothetical protein